MTKWFLLILIGLSPVAHSMMVTCGELIARGDAFFVTKKFCNLSLRLKPSTHFVQEQLTALINKKVCAFGYKDEVSQKFDAINVELDTFVSPYIEDCEMFKDFGPEGDIDTGNIDPS